MSARSLITHARAVGVSLWADGSLLRWRVSSPPSGDLPDLLAQLRLNKSAVMAVLRSDLFGPRSPRDSDAPPPAEAIAECERWAYMFHERAGLREHDAGLSRTEAERLALQDCAARWRFEHPLAASEPHEPCVHCGGAGPCTGVPARGGHVWVHRECWVPMNRVRDAMARTAVLKMLGRISTEAADGAQS